MKKQTWSVPTAIADKCMKRIELRLQAMFGGKMKRGTVGKLKVIYPFMGGQFGDDCRLDVTYIGIEKKNNSEMYIRFIQGDIDSLNRGFGSGMLSEKWVRYHDEIKAFIEFVIKNPDEEWI